MSAVINPPRRSLALPGDAYASARAALGRLTADPGDLIAFTDYLKSLVVLGLGGAGQRLIARAATTVGAESDARRVLKQFAEVVSRCPTGRVDWAACADQLNSNLSALRRRLPEASESLAIVDLGALELYHDTYGRPQVLDLMTLQWLGGLSDRRAAAVAAFSGKSAINPSAPIAFDGIGLGELFDEFMRRSRHTFLSYSAAVAVVEPDPIALAIALRLYDWAEALAEPRLSIYVGTQAEHEFLSHLRTDPNQPVPATIQRLPLTLRPPTQLPKALAQLALERAQCKARVLADVNEWHQHHDRRFWAKRFAEALGGHGRPLRVMGITSRFTTVLRYSMRELLDAAARAGCETELVWEQSDHAVEYNVPARVKDFVPDLVIMISRLRHEFPDIPRQIPFLCWDQDALPVMRTAAVGESLDRLTFVAGYGAWFGLSHLHWPASQVLAEVPIAASHAYVQARIDAPIDDRFRCDIAYISHCSEAPRQMRDRLAQDWSAHPVVSRIYSIATERLIDRSAAGYNWTPSELYTLVCDAAAEIGVKVTDAFVREMCMTCMSLSDRAFRHYALECVARYADQAGRRFHLYGAGWDRHKRLSKFAAGRVSFGDEFVAACRGARLNLQLIEGGFLHSRSLDGLAAGGAFLTRSTRYDLERARMRALALRVGRRSAAELASEEKSELGPSCGVAADGPQAGLDFWLQTIPLEPDAHELLPDLPRISFTDLESLASTADSLLADDATRQRIARDMRAQALAAFTYDSHWARLVDFIRRSLERD